ncbi:MAG: AAA family ATPase [Caldilineaceae bacterium]|nr:AAA family ATPase [Caldilineaceae bacterium]
MPNSTFRIENVSIEGFKAFTNQQTFYFWSRHVFLFGQNGLGKTSIVEAIRWCLFGLASRPGEIVKNQFYDGPCVVQITLAASDGQWTMQRRLRLSGGDSDIIIRDPSGLARNLEDVFPQLSRIGPREGTHVIYAAQQPSSRRPEADITDFSYVVYRYLGLEEVPRLSDVLLALSKDWTHQEDEICQEVEALGETLSHRISGVEESIIRITSDPPWGDFLTPTASDTQDKVDQLVREAEQLGVQCSSEELESSTPDEKLYEVETAIHSFLSGESVGLGQKLTALSSMIQSAEVQLENGQAEIHQIQEQSRVLETLIDDLDSALDGSQIGDLEEQLQSVEVDLESTQLKLDVVRSSLKYFEAIGDETPPDLCPICEGSILLGELKLQLKRVETSSDHKSTEILQQRERLRESIATARQLSERIEAKHTDIAQHRSDLEELLKQASQTYDLSFPASIEHLGNYVDEIRKGHKNLQSVLDSQREALKTWESRIEKVRQELRFHHLLALKRRLQRLRDVRYDALHSSLKDLADLRDIADEIRSLISSQLQDRLRDDLPPVAQEMTEVYLRLTGSPTFDSISIRQGEKTDGSMTLDLRVSSSRGPGTWGVEHGILNGQALNAIQLVPYFVFSRYQSDPLLDLLLLDDPTQAFDTHKINLLLTELANAASHATLFVATHEEDRFLPILKNYFNPDDVKAYKAVKISEDGPLFEDVPIPL